MKYSLKQYFEEAQVGPIPDWFADIFIAHPKLGWIKPRWHQVTALNQVFVFQRYSLFDDMGSGKTLPAQAYAIWHAVMGNKPVCLMPHITLKQFQNSFFQTFIGIEKYITVQIYHGTPKKRNAIAIDLFKQNEEGKQLPIMLTTDTTFMREFVLFTTLGCCVLIGDEATYISNVETKTRRAIDNFMGAYGDKCALTMTGTPANNDLSNLYGYINFNTPSAYKGWLHFAHTHIEYQDINIKVKDKRSGALRSQTIARIDQFKNLELLEQNLYKQARRIEKEQVMELPDLSIVDYDIYLNDKHAQKYEEFAIAKVMVFEDGQAITGEQSATMRQIAMQSVIHPEYFQLEEESAVMEAIDQLIASINVGVNKIFILGHYNKTIERVTERYKKYGARSLYGGNTPSKNEKSKEAFLNDDDCRILVANFQSGGVGLNLQDVCWYAIVAEPTTVPGDFKQAVDRLHRSGQVHKVTVSCIRVLKTLFVKAIQSMQRKDGSNKAVVSRAQLLAELRGEEIPNEEEVAKLPASM